MSIRVPSGSKPASLRIRVIWVTTVLLQNPLEAIHALLEHLQSWSIRDSNKVVTRAVKQIASACRIEVEEDSGYHDDLFFEACVEEVQSVEA